MRPVPVNGDIANLVDYEELGLAVELELLFNPVFRIGLCEGGNQWHCLHEIRPISLSGGLDSKRDGQMGFAHTGRPQENDVFAVGNKPAGGEFLDLLFVYGRLEVEIKALQGLTKGNFAMTVRIAIFFSVLAETSCVKS